MFDYNRVDIYECECISLKWRNLTIGKVTSLLQRNINHNVYTIIVQSRVVFERILSNPRFDTILKRTVESARIYNHILFNKNYR